VSSLSDELWLGLRLLALLAVANSAPIIAKRWLGARFAWPLDGGLRFPLDGRPLLGPSKTVRGLLAAVLATALGALLLGLPMATGALLGAGAMAGDALSSFVKRRLGVPSSGKATGLDQIPEALLPLLMLRSAGLALPLWLAGLITLVFFLAEMPLARLFHRLGLREQPY
jgi:CDP-2,3-bis-(O-geranylgeranyl)-sn-glycerol synthase